MGSRSQLRLLMLTPNFPPQTGGVQNYALELAFAFSELCSEFEVLAPKSPGSEQVDRELPFKIKRKSIWGDNFSLSGILPARRASRHFDAVFATHWSAAYAALIAGDQNWAVGCAVHGKELFFRPLEKIWPAQKVYDHIRKTALKQCPLLFPVSRFTADLLKKYEVKEDRIITVPNGVNTERYKPGDSTQLREGLGLVSKTVLLTVGRLVERKGVDTVLKSLATIKDEHKDLEYLIVGDGPERSKLEALSQKLGLSEQVRFMGAVTSKALLEFYQLADLFVMAPRDIRGDVEGFGLVFLEASACGKAVLGTRSGGVPDAVLDGVTGVLVSPDNSMELARVLDDLIKNKDKRDALGTAGFEFANQQGSWKGRAHTIVESFEEELLDREKRIK
ncbi:MAG: glycosyltransferase family 4 protein [Myxococcales bacterium]|nr:MAG: glycosyltransferase family 4 protein [Myxococcales bacterium]